MTEYSDYETDLKNEILVNSGKKELPNLKPRKIKAMILAGGLGTRLREISIDKPKPLVPFLGVPFLEHQLRLLKSQGITDVVLCVSYMADKIKSYFGTGKRIGMELSYSEEEIPLGTAGAIRKAKHLVDDIFFVMNGDSYFDLDFKKLLEFHLSNEGISTLALTSVSSPEHGNIVSIDSKGKIIDFSKGSLQSNSLINAGFYVFDKRIFDYIPADKNTSLENEVFPKLIKETPIHGYIHQGYFIDIGRPESYLQFKKDILGALLLKEGNNVREAMQKISRNGIDIVLVVDDRKRILGVVNDRIIKEFLMSDGNIESSLSQVMAKNPIVARKTDSPSKIAELLSSGMRYLPIIDLDGTIVDVETHLDKIKIESFPVIRGKSPLRISFAGGGTDLPYFFEKHGGAVISATIDKYCYATLIKRADRKIMIDSDVTKEIDVSVQSVDSLSYDGKLDLIKAVINIIQPDFGFELYLYNDLPPGRGLGSSASLAVLVAKMLGHLMGNNYDDYRIAEIAYRAEHEELKIKGGWQDQYASAVGGFNFMEFNQNRTVIYPLRLKNETIQELSSHLMLCYIGNSHFSGDVHTIIEKSFIENESEKLDNLNKLKQITLEMKDVLLTGQLEDFGRLLRDSWECKRSMSKEVSNTHIDNLYDLGLKNGAYGGKLLGAGNGGYLLFFYSPRKRNVLKKALGLAGGEILNFNFDLRGVEIWQGKNKF